MTSLPIYWGEPAEMTDLLNGSVAPHRVRTLLEQEYTLLPLDALGTADGEPVGELGRLDRLLVAQPRALTAADNVALDRWVRAGGRLLLVLDPMMTDHSAYAVGDKRRYNDVALVPPVLTRWGLAMTFEEGIPPRSVPLRKGQLLVDEHGTLSPAVPPASGASCQMQADGVIARCRIGAGTALIVADAAFLNAEGGEDADNAVDMIVADIFR